MRERATKPYAKIIMSALALAGILCPLVEAKIVVFGYDQAGNRIKREISAPQMQSRAGGNFSSEMIESDFVTIGPNPTTGVVKVEISNYEAGDNGRIYVYTTAGQLIAAVDIQSSTTDINIGSHAAGIYVFVVETEKASARSMILKK